MERVRADLDVIIIGGGPAGLSAALWCRDLGMNALLFEGKKDLGGQLMLTFNPIEKFIGARAANGREMRDRFAEHVRSLDVQMRTDAAVASVDLKAGVVILNDGRSVTARTIIIATGVRRRSLRIPGETEWQGRGVLVSGVESKDAMAGKKVVIVGGGDAAIENAILLSENAERVIVIHRRMEFTARADFLDKARIFSKIQFMPESEVRAINGDRSVTSVEVSNLRNGNRTVVDTDAVLIRIGVQPNTEIFRGQIDLDANGYIVIDASNSASLPGIFAAGDVARPLSPTVSTAVGDGASAAKSARALIDSTVRV